MKRALLRVLQHLVVIGGLDHNNSILSDRTFLVNALKIIKANAILNGRDRCNMEDLYRLNMLTTFRVPMEAHEQIDDVIKQANIAEKMIIILMETMVCRLLRTVQLMAILIRTKSSGNRRMIMQNLLSNDNENEKENYPGGDSSMPQMDSSSDIETIQKVPELKVIRQCGLEEIRNENVEPYKSLNGMHSTPVSLPNAEDDQDKLKTDINLTGRNEFEERTKQLQAKARADEANVTDAYGGNNDITVKGLERLMRGLHGKIQSL